MYELVDNLPQNAVIKVIGIGGGGCSAVKHMIESRIEGVDFICVDSDVQALSGCISGTVIQLGSSLTKGLGSGGDPEIGQRAALENRKQISEVLHGADMVFITAGMGGGTGTGGAPVVAKAAKELGILTVAVVTTPFSFEGDKRKNIADQGMKELQRHVDSIITIPNEELLVRMDKDTSLSRMFDAANEVQCDAIQGIADLIVRPGMINVDFADVRTVMSETGGAAFGAGKARGKDRAQKAAESAIQSSLLKDFNLQNARGFLVNITAGLDLSLGEFSEIGDAIEEYASENATVVVGTVIDPEMGDSLRVTVVATGIELSVYSSKPSESKNRKSEQIPDDARGDNIHLIAGDIRSVEKHNEYLDIPHFLSEQMASSPDFNWRSTDLLEGLDTVCIISKKGTPDKEISELIYHLSNLYKSVGGDELIIENITDLPPDASESSRRHSQKRRSAGF